MATTTTTVSVAEYLATVYEPEVDYVDGELEDRNVGEWDHSALQFRIMELLRATEGLLVRPELRIQVAPTRFRVPDVAVYLESPGEQVPTVPPFLVVEVLSPEDRIHRIMRKLHDYTAMGCVNIWVLDPRDKVAYQFDGTALTQVNDSLTCIGGTPAISVAELFS